jgi:hypothetical protein
LPSSEEVPGGQRSHIIDPASEKYPEWQFSQTVFVLERFSSPKVPAGHKSQNCLPGDSEYDPALQGLHSVVPF